MPPHSLSEVGSHVSSDRSERRGRPPSPLSSSSVVNSLAETLWRVMRHISNAGGISNLCSRAQRTGQPADVWMRWGGGEGEGEGEGEEEWRWEGTTSQRLISLRRHHSRRRRKIYGTSWTSSRLTIPHPPPTPPQRQPTMEAAMLLFSFFSGYFPE